MIYETNNYIVDTQRFRLEFAGQTVPVKPRVFDLLVYLIQNRRRVVTREELLEVLWENQVVSDSALNARLKGARRVLGDNGIAQELIRTVHGRGYQFIGEVFENPKKHNIPEPVSGSGMGMGMGMGMGTIGQKTLRQTITSPSIPSIAVLPFVNMSGDPTQDNFSDGLTENIITQLSRFRDLFVVASHSAFAYKNKRVNIPRVSRHLGVHYILEGSVQKLDSLLRISVQLIDGESGHQLWGERYDRKLDNSFEVQDELTGSIVGILASVYGGRLRKAWQKRSPASRLEHHQAFDYFMRAIDAVDQFTREDNNRGKEYLKKAVALDPDYTKAYAKLSWTHILDVAEGWGDDYDASMRAAKQLALKSIQCDDNEAWGHWAYAGYCIYAREYDLALTGFQKVVDLNPNDSDTLVDYGYYLTYFGRAKEGLAYAYKAMDLNPHYPDWYLANLVQIQHDARQYENAIQSFKRLSEGEWTLARLYVAASHAALGNDRQAADAITHIQKIDPSATLHRWAELRRAPYRYPSDLEHFRENLCKAGLPEGFKQKIE